MRSTRQLLLTPFVLSRDSNDQQLEKIGEASGNTIHIPALYLDKIYEITMDHPHNIRLSAKSDPYYVDHNTLELIVKNKGACIHPLDNLTHNFLDYPQDTDLAKRITVFVTIHAIKHHVDILEAERQKNLLPLLGDKTNHEANVLLAFHSTDFLHAISFPIHAVPARFFSRQPGKRVMTLPVVLDNSFIIDFFELLEMQPEVQHHCDGPIIAEFTHPYTCQPIRDISVHYKLLAELDEFLEKSPLTKQLLTIKYFIKRYDETFKRHQPQHANKSFAQILKDMQFPVEKIPESLMVGILNDTKTIVTTHPIILDGTCTVDYAVLMQFWEYKKSNWGINPFTGKTVKTMEYDEKLKSDINQFMLNLDYYQQTIRQEKIVEGSYMRSNGKSWSYGFHAGMFPRNGKTQNQGLNKLAEIFEAEATTKESEIVPSISRHI
jgi:hypothetical protein